MTLEDGPLDPFADDPEDPATLLGDTDPVIALSASERADIKSDLAEVLEFRTALEPRDLQGIALECGDCGELHFFGWDLMAANLRALLSAGHTQVHEPACDPEVDRYVSWEYARGYTDAVRKAARRR